MPRSLASVWSVQLPERTQLVQRASRAARAAARRWSCGAARTLRACWCGRPCRRATLLLQAATSWSTPSTSTMHTRQRADLVDARLQVAQRGDVDPDARGRPPGSSCRRAPRRPVPSIVIVTIASILPPRNEPKPKWSQRRHLRLPGGPPRSRGRAQRGRSPPCARTASRSLELAAAALVRASELRAAGSSMSTPTSWSKPR